MTFTEYRCAFERRVIVEGVRTGLLGKIERISVRPNGVAYADMKRRLGTILDTWEACCVDYYGFRKLSAGLHEAVEQERIRNRSVQIRYIECPVVYFARIWFEHLLKLAPDLVSGFPEFKRHLLMLRGFDHEYGPCIAHQ